MFASHFRWRERDAIKIINYLITCSQINCAKRNTIRQVHQKRCAVCMHDVGECMHACWSYVSCCFFCSLLSILLRKLCVCRAQCPMCSKSALARSPLFAFNKKTKYHKQSFFYFYDKRGILHTHSGTPNKIFSDTISRLLLLCIFWHLVISVFCFIFWEFGFWFASIRFSLFALQLSQNIHEMLLLQIVSCFFSRFWIFGIFFFFFFGYKLVENLFAWHICGFCIVT